MNERQLLRDLDSFVSQLSQVTSEVQRVDAFSTEVLRDFVFDRKQLSDHYDAHEYIEQKLGEIQCALNRAKDILGTYRDNLDVIETLSDVPELFE